MLDLRGNSRYQFGLSSHFSGFKLASNPYLYLMFIILTAFPQYYAFIITYFLLWESARPGVLLFAPKQLSMAAKLFRPDH